MDCITSGATAEFPKSIPMPTGSVRRPLIFTLDALARYPMESRIVFLECAGNGADLYEQDPVDETAQTLQGLISCAEWTGVKLSMLLDEAGVDPRAQWLLAEGADAPTMSRSIPMAKATKDAMIALYQNGERLRPSNGYPNRRERSVTVRSLRFGRTRSAASRMASMPAWTFSPMPTWR
jgi:hypothetical protein